MKKAFTSLSIQDPGAFIFGSAPNPLVLKNGMVIGGGTVFPELNFTLPDMAITPETTAEVYEQYRMMIDGACTRAAELHAPGLVVEFELLPDMTLIPDLGAEITRILRKRLDEMQARHGIPGALRVTPNDIREFTRPPLLRQGEFLDLMTRSFELCAEAGADFLAIESTGGKEIHDNAILNGDLAQSVFALGVLGARDMAFLWERITGICERYDVTPSGDSACGFANTAMVLAEGGFIPRVWAALIRLLSVPRSLVAFEQGARGPNKDCAYEGPYIKAITGCPISLEGSEAACAHLSPIGNIARATPDLWSNESINNVKLLGAMAPTVSLEQLVYATRLMNTASTKGAASARTLRDLYVDSDASSDPQAYILRPEIVVALAGEIVEEETPYLRTRRAARSGLRVLRQGVEEWGLGMTKKELRWLDNLNAQAEALPEDESAFIAQIAPVLDSEKIRLSEYGL